MAPWMILLVRAAGILPVAAYHYCGRTASPISKPTGRGELERCFANLLPANTLTLCAWAVLQELRTEGKVCRSEGALQLAIYECKKYRVFLRRRALSCQAAAV
jgi:hypothetical protein